MFFLHNLITCWMCALYVLFLVPKSGLSLICATGLSWRGEALGNLAGHCALKGCQDFDKIWLFSFLSKSCADLEKGNGKLQGLLVEWGLVAKKDQSWGEISLKQNPKLWKNILKEFWFRTFQSGQRSPKKTSLGKIFHLLFWIINAWNHCWFRDWILCIFCALSLF